MLLAKVKLSSGEVRCGVVEGSAIRLIRQTDRIRTLADVLHSANPIETARSLVDTLAAPTPISSVEVLAPIDQQEVWAAGVTYKRSQVARMEESETGASHYDRVYTAPRPEIFFKATPNRVAGPGKSVRIRKDTNWSVPEPELTLVVAPDLRLIGFTIGNDMSARDIEGENPLYLPQAKLYDDCCGLGPFVLLLEQPMDRVATKIQLEIERGGLKVFSGETNVDQMKRGFEELITWLGKDNHLATGAFLLTGTGVVPPNEFTLKSGDIVSISITGIGTLTNPVVQG